jgi:cytochrome c-type protein NapC
MEKNYLGSKNIAKQENKDRRSANMLAHSWRALRRPSTRYSSGALLTVGVVTGIILWGAFNTAMEATNTETFCISCHEMKENVYREYKKTIHYTNRTGVRATCPDCHVPKEWVHMFVRKVQATNELFHHFGGSVSTPEKFATKRLTLAKVVWKNMKATDSRECRNCHDFVSMDLDAQKHRGRKQHRQSLKEDKTCIDCHQGIAHKLPAEFVEAEHERYEREGVPCADCHEGMARAPADDDWGKD